MSISTAAPVDCSLPPRTEPEPFSRRDIPPIVLLCAAWTILAFVIDPRGDFPIIDDWAYALPVRAVLERGEIRLTDWSTAIQGIHIFYGAAFCLATGFSFTALRISTLVAGLAGLIGSYALMRQLKASRAVALFGAATVGANPIYLAMSYTFMTDVPFACLVVFSTFLLVRGMVCDSDRAMWLGLALAAASVLVRQIGVAILLGFIVAYPFWRGLGRRWLIEAVLPAVLALVALKACERGLIALECLPRAYNKSTDSTATFLALLAKGRLGVFKFTIPKIGELSLILGLYAAPLTFLCLPSWLAPLSHRRRIVELGFVATLTVLVTTALAVAGWGILKRDIGHIVFDFGVGPRFTPAEALRVSPPRRMPLVFNIAITAIAVAGAVFAFLALGRVAWKIALCLRHRDPRALCLALVLLVAICAVYCGPISLSFLMTWDRYVLGILPLVLPLVWYGSCATGAKQADGFATISPLGVALGGMSLLISLAFATAATHDYLDWSRVRWNEDLKLAREVGVAATEIDGGWEYNNYFANLGRLYKSRQERDLELTPQEKVGGVWGQRLDRPYRVSSYLAKGYELIRRAPLSPWLPLAPTEFIVSRRTGALPSPAKR